MKDKLEVLGSLVNVYEAYSRHGDQIQSVEVRDKINAMVEEVTAEYVYTKPALEGLMHKSFIEVVEILREKGLGIKICKVK